jgi:hypothetical protein
LEKNLDAAWLKIPHLVQNLSLSVYQLIQTIKAVFASLWCHFDPEASGRYSGLSLSGLLLFSREKKFSLLMAKYHRTWFSLTRIIHKEICNYHI